MKNNSIKCVENVHPHQSQTKKAAALFIIAKNEKQPRCPSVCDEINKLQYIYTKEQCSLIKRKKLSGCKIT